MELMELIIYILYIPLGLAVFLGLLYTIVVMLPLVLVMLVIALVCDIITYPLRAILRSKNNRNSYKKLYDEILNKGKKE